MNPIVQQVCLLILAIFAIAAVMASYRKATEVLEGQLKISQDAIEKLRYENLALREDRDLS